jgi:hypothetical protein
MVTNLSRVGIYKIHLEEISAFFVDFCNQLHRFYINFSGMLWLFKEGLSGPS